MIFLRFGNTVTVNGMLDERTGLLLSAVNESCVNGSFKIVEEGELLRVFPKTLGVDGQTLRAMLSYLEDRGYIEVGYAEEGEYCVRPLPEGRTYFERLKREGKARVRRRIEAFLLALFGGFTGGFLGALIAGLFAAGGAP